MSKQKKKIEVNDVVIGHLSKLEKETIGDKIFDFYWNLWDKHPYIWNVFCLWYALCYFIGSLFIPFIVIKEYFKALFKAYYEWYNHFSPKSQPSSYGAIDLLKHIWRGPTPYITKLASYFHVEKPEVADEFIIEAFRDWLYVENAIQYQIPGIQDKELVKKIYYQIQELKKYDKLLKKMETNPKFDYQMFDTFRTRFANSLWKIRKSFWV